MKRVIPGGLEFGALALLLLAGPGMAQEQPRSRYDGAALMFERAQLIKPNERTSPGPAFALAPLIIQEVRGGNPPSVPARIFYQPGTVQLHGCEYGQMTYWWRYEAAKPLARPAPPRRGPEIRPLPCAVSEAGALDIGVRLTLNPSGSPLIYEILGSSSSVAQIFVSQSVEAAARAEFGTALPGRRHAVERSLAEAPGVVVPRIVDDPPAVMGPILYLRAGTHDVATLICRCMDSQAKTVVAQSFYELVPTGASSNTSDATRLAAADTRGHPRDFLFQTNRLSRSLRLPSGF